ncbi:hypothetical protein [Kitasatospora sp. LaBMicrA B282]|uniref:hypothetical protein n=1 Tax=Kitasatospora sp. LaBMicrA B282 TaxID=3420949 RepID=UPI003D0DEE0E
MSVRFARRRSRLVTAAATAVLLGTALPLIGGASAAFAADGNGTAPAAAAAAPAAPIPVRQVSPLISYLPGTPGTITAGGSSIEFGVEMANFTGVPYDSLAPVLGLSGANAGPQAGTRLQPADFTVQVMAGGQWRTLPLHSSASDPFVHVDTTSLAQHLDNGRAARFMFRITLAAGAPTDQQTLTVQLTTSAGGPGPAAYNLHIVHPQADSGAPTGTTTKSPATPAKPAAPTTPATPTKPTKPARQQPAAAQPAAAAAPVVRADAQPAAAATSPTALPTTPGTSPQQLAFTGGGDSTGLLVGAGGALVVVGAGAVFLAGRRRSTTGR